MSQKWYNKNLAKPVKPRKSAIETLALLDSYKAAALAETDKPIIMDVRPDGHNSFSVLPKLGADEYDRLQEFYGFEWLTAYGKDAASSGDLYFGLYAIELKAGPAIVQPRVFDANGDPAEGVLAWFSWPGAESLPSEATPKYKSMGVHGWTDGTGSCGWAYGGEAHIGENGGPFTVWCNAGTGPLGTLIGSDALDKIGFWDDHITPNPWFKVMRKGGTSVEPGEYALWNVDADGNVIGKIYFSDGGTDPGPLGTLVLVKDDSPLGFVDWGE